MRIHPRLFAALLCYSELDRLQGAYESERDYDYGRFENDQSFDYGMHMDSQNFQYQTERDAVADDQWNQQWQYQQERDQIDDKRYAEKVAQAQIDYLISIGADIPDSLIAASGYDPAYVAAIQASRAAQAVTYYGGGGSGGSGRSSGSSGGGNVDLVAEATKVSQTMGAGAAMKYIQEQTGGEKSAESVMAQANAKGVSQTEYYKKMLEAQQKAAQKSK